MTIQHRIILAISIAAGLLISLGIFWGLHQEPVLNAARYGLTGGLLSGTIVCIAMLETTREPHASNASQILQDRAPLGVFRSQLFWLGTGLLFLYFVFAVAMPLTLSVSLLHEPFSWLLHLVALIGFSLCSAVLVSDDWNIREKSKHVGEVLILTVTMGFVSGLFLIAYTYYFRAPSSTLWPSISKLFLIGIVGASIGMLFNRKKRESNASTRPSREDAVKRGLVHKD
ncbi:MAG: hypothetical protein PHI06_15240 [Desulfobulbaceae bacterium]|nr:hypothetical protein [Desulfobulbaceae bacterium]